MKNNLSTTLAKKTQSFVFVDSEFSIMFVPSSSLAMCALSFTFVSNKNNNCPGLLFKVVATKEEIHFGLLTSFFNNAFKMSVKTKEKVHNKKESLEKITISGNFFPPSCNLQNMFSI